MKLREVKPDLNGMRTLTKFKFSKITNTDKQKGKIHKIKDNSFRERERER